MLQYVNGKPGSVASARPATRFRFAGTPFHALRRREARMKRRRVRLQRYGAAKAGPRLFDLAQFEQHVPEVAVGAGASWVEVEGAAQE